VPVIRYNEFVTLNGNYPCALLRATLIAYWRLLVLHLFA